MPTTVNTNPDHAIPAASVRPEVTAGYLAIEPGYVEFLQWTEQDGQLTGSYTSFGVSGMTALDGLISRDGALRGVLDGHDISITMDDGNVQRTYNGTLVDSILTLYVTGEANMQYPVDYQPAILDEFEAASRAFRERHERQADESAPNGDSAVQPDPNNALVHGYLRIDAQSVEYVQWTADEQGRLVGRIHTTKRSNTVPPTLHAESIDFTGVISGSDVRLAFPGVLWVPERTVQGTLESNALTLVLPDATGLLVPVRFEQTGSDGYQAAVQQLNREIEAIKHEREMEARRTTALDTWQTAADRATPYYDRARLPRSVWFTAVDTSGVSTYVRAVETKLDQARQSATAGDCSVMERYLWDLDYELSRRNDIASGRDQAVAIINQSITTMKQQQAVLGVHAPEYVVSTTDRLIVQQQPAIDAITEKSVLAITRVEAAATARQTLSCAAKGSQQP